MLIDPAYRPLTVEEQCRLAGLARSSYYYAPVPMRPEDEALLRRVGIAISMDGRGRWVDNVFVERLWRSAKYECVYLHDFETPLQAERELTCYFDFYNHGRPHQGLGNATPEEVWSGRRTVDTGGKMGYEALAL